MVAFTKIVIDRQPSTVTIASKEQMAHGWYDAGVVTLSAFRVRFPLLPMLLIGLAHELDVVHSNVSPSHIARSPSFT